MFLPHKTQRKHTKKQNKTKKNIYTIGHKFYGIKRRQLLAQSVNSMVINNNSNYQLYKSDQNITRFCKELFVQPNVVLSMIGQDKYKSRHVPLLFVIGETDDYKMFELFLDCLFHFDKVLLGNKIQNKENKEEMKNSFLYKYFNYNKCNSPIVEVCEFFGLTTTEMTPKDIGLIETIMKSDYFNGMNQITDDTEALEIFYQAAMCDCFEYVKLLEKYFDKNSKILTKALNWTDDGDDEIDGTHWLSEVIEMSNSGTYQDWFDVFFKICQKAKVNFKQAYIDQVIEYINDNVGAYQKYQLITLLKQNINKLKI